MGKQYLRIMLLFCALISFSATSWSMVKGIYVTQYSLENTTFLNYLIKKAKAAGIDTFVVDIEKPNRQYDNNIALLKQSNIKYVARVVMFHNGGTKQQVENPEVWQKKYELVRHAVAIGANEVQLDYIRYNTKQKKSPDNAKNIHTIISWYKKKLEEHSVPLQIDVFGVASFGESSYIGQNLKLFAQTIDALCPMVYPSHYIPYPEHFKHPYDTVLESLLGVKKQLSDSNRPVKVYAYIELSNYHYPMNHARKMDYIKAQIKAVEAAGADGWYAWSPHNRYENLFELLEEQQ